MKERYVTALCKIPKDTTLWRTYYQKRDVVPEDGTGEGDTLVKITGGCSKRTRFLSVLFMAPERLGFWGDSGLLCPIGRK